jgi:hypothetical protein
MKIYYYLPNALIYDSIKNEFKNISFELAVKYLKLIYDDLATFQHTFLVKLKKVDDLKQVLKILENSFVECSVLNEKDLPFISDKDITIIAKTYFVNQQKVTSNRGSYFQNFIKKFKEFMELEESIEGNSEIIGDYTNYKKVNAIDAYVLIEEDKSISFELACVEKLIIQSEIHHLVCKQTNLKEIQLNKELLNLEIAGNRLQSLQCNEDLEELFISNNQLEHLVLNANLSVLICNGNALKELHLNKKLKELYCMNNQLESLALNIELVRVQAQLNPLKKIILNQNVREIEVSHPGNESILFDNSVGNTKVVVHYYIT